MQENLWANDLDQEEPVVSRCFRFLSGVESWELFSRALIMLGYITIYPVKKYNCDDVLYPLGLLELHSQDLYPACLLRVEHPEANSDIPAGTGTARTCPQVSFWS